MQVPIVWQEIPEFVQMAEKLIEHFPERFGHIEADWLIGYAATNKDKPDGKKCWDITGEKEPQAFTNTKKYFFTTYLDAWMGRSENSRYWFVFAALERIDRDMPGSGKLKPYDYKDQGVMVRTVGPDWEDRGNLPNPLTDDIDFIEVARTLIDDEEDKNENKETI